jgi:hypothetical protein
VVVKPVQDQQTAVVGEDEGIKAVDAVEDSAVVAAVLPPMLPAIVANLILAEISILK